MSALDEILDPSNWEEDEQWCDGAPLGCSEVYYVGIPVYREAADELATLRAQLAEAREANDRLIWRMNWIRINPSDSVATRYALKATDEEVDDIRSKE